MKKLGSVIIFTLCIMISACTTTNYEPYTIPNDKIITFATVKEPIGDIQANSLIMFGEKLNYVIEPPQSIELSNILTQSVHLSNHITTNGADFHISLDKNNHFKKRFYLFYEVSNQQSHEIEILTQLGFKFNHKLPSYSVYRYDSPVILGKIYERNQRQEIPDNARLKKPIAVRISTTEKQLDWSLMAAPVTAPLFVAGGVVFVAPAIFVMTMMSGKLE